MTRKTLVLAPLAVAAVLVTACSGNSEAHPSPARQSPSVDNPRGAVQVALGDRAEVDGPDGKLVLAVADTRLSAQGCKPHETDPANITKQWLWASVEVGGQTYPQWLDRAGFYYVDAAGMITKNSSITDLAECNRPKVNAFYQLPANSKAEGSAATLDIPNSAVTMGYTLTLGGGHDVRIEWSLPQRG